MSFSRIIEAPAAPKKAKSHLYHHSTSCNGTPPSGYQPAAPVKQGGYIPVAPVEHITDEMDNVISDDQLLSILGNCQHDPGYSSAPQDHREISQAGQDDAKNDEITCAPILADMDPLDVVYDKTYNIPTQEQYVNNEIGAPYRGEATRESSLEALPELQEPVYQALQRSLHGNSRSSQLQSRTPGGKNDVESRKYEAHQRQPIVRQSQPADINSPHSNWEISRTYNALPGVRQDHENETAQNPGALDQRNTQNSAQYLPLQSIESDSEESDDEVESTLASREGHPLPSIRKTPGAAAKRQSENAPRGDTREVDGELQCTYEGKWKYAVRLDDIRSRILAEEKRRGTYDYPWAKGRGKNDETSYHPAYKSWGWERDQRPEILFQFERNSHRVPAYSPKIWIDRGRIVLDPDDNPIMLWREIPLLCSSNMSGAELEAISRTNSDIPLSALRARMPAQIVKGRKFRPLFDLNTLRMRMGRFRMKAGCIAWNEREGSKQIKYELAQILGPRCIGENSTRSFGRDLSTLEVDSLKAVNKGTVPQRSRKKRPADTDDESSFAPTPKRQNTMPSPFSQEHPAGPAQVVRMGSVFAGQGRARQLNNLVPYPHGQKFRRARADTEQSEDASGLPQTGRLSTGPHGSYGYPYQQQSSKTKGYPPYDHPSGNLSSRKRGRQLDSDTSDNEADQEDSSLPLKRRRLDVVPTQPKRAIRSAAIESRRPSRAKHYTDVSVDHGSGGGFYHLPDDTSYEGITPFANNERLQTFSRQKPQTDRSSVRATPSGLAQPPNSHHTIVEGSTPGFRTGTNLGRGPLGSNVSLLPPLQTDPYLLFDALANHTTPFAAQPPAKTFARQALDLAGNPQAQNWKDSILDFRYVKPKNAAEEESIQQALLFTRDSFEILSGEDAPDTPRNQSYATQLGLLQRALTDIWDVDDPQPDLFFLDSPWQSFPDLHALTAAINSQSCA